MDWTAGLTAEETADLALLGIDWQARVDADLANIARLAGIERTKVFSTLGVSTKDLKVTKADEQEILLAAKTAAEIVASKLPPADVAASADAEVIE